MRGRALPGHSPLVFVCLAAILLGAAAPLPAGLDSAELQRRGEEVAKMTEVERDRLQRNWETFQKLPPERRQHYRQLHEELQTDLKSGGNQLNQMMQTYTSWLRTLTPGQCADLRKAKTAAEKLTLVRKFKSDQDFENQSQVFNEPVEDFSRQRWRFLMGRSRPFAPVEFAAAMTALAELLPGSEGDELSATNGRLDKWSRYRRIIQASAREAGGPSSWPDKEQQAAIFAAISKSERAARLKAIPDDQERRKQFVRVIFSSLAEELLTDSRPYQPTEKELEHLYENLDNMSREALMVLPLEQVKQELIRQYRMKVMSNNPEYRKFVASQNDLFNFAKGFLKDSDVFRWGNPGDRPPFPPGAREGDGPGDRGLRDRGRRGPPRREDDRPPPDRPPEN